ncbi:F0F1 ATP synthase subunit gamma [Candidatus Babeliales bacterium]|nr:F0F1 ATP synthase subunit gamma [Candidatus Babeliales bacterium]
MASLMPLRRRITAVKATQKLTHAMRLVAIASHSKQKNGYAIAQRHRQMIESTFFEIIKTYPKWRHPILTPENQTNSNPLIIIISPIRGMCGSFRNNLVRYAATKLKFEYYQSPSFITIGSRAQQIAQTSLEAKSEKTPNIITHFAELSVNSIIDVSQEINSAISSQKKPFSRITYLGSTFVNLFTQKPKLHTIAPLLPPENGNHQKKTEIVKYIWEQEKEKILETFAQNYLRITIQQALYESLFAEDAARFVAMDMATTNAEKHLETMKLEFNKIRQTSITQEVTELSSAF